MAEPEHGTSPAPASNVLDTLRATDWVQRWKLRLTIIAFLVAVGWWGSTFFRGDEGHMLYSRGPVASVHATWDADCAACHENFQPMGTQAGVSRFLGNPHASDALCIHCHAGPAHSGREINSEVHACADCHREHRGRDASLVHVPDSDCTRCHADLKAHVKQTPPQYADATRFAGGQHPPFRPLSSDPGRLAFNHQVHMTPGMGAAAEKPVGHGQVPFTLAQISEDERERYRQPDQPKARDAENKVQLTCASCHQTDSGDFGVARSQLAGLPESAVLPPRGDGAYMLPITYENQCKACHPLTIEKPAGKDVKPLTVPHRLQPEQVHDFLVNTYVGRYVGVDRDHWFDQPFVQPRRPRPGEAVEPPPEQKTVRTEIDQAVQKAELKLYSGKLTCGECHQYATKKENANLAELLRPGVRPDFRIEPTQVPAVWLPHARFNHASHRALNCRDCHARAFADDPHASTASADVLIPGMDNCLQCHAPRTDKGGGARFDCVECHRYHHGDAPLQGRGAAARRSRQPMTVEQFLTGGVGK